jgi:hypothetical protein
MYVLLQQSFFFAGHFAHSARSDKKCKNKIREKNSKMGGKIKRKIPAGNEPIFRSRAQKGIHLAGLS